MPEEVKKKVSRREKAPAKVVVTTAGEGAAYAITGRVA